MDKIKGTGDFRYAYTEDKTVIFSRAKKKMPAAVTETTPDAQQLRVSGTITDPNGMPLPGVNIIVKDAKRGTMSDPDGKYDIRVNPSDVLVFSYVGFKKQEQAVNGQEVLDVVMEEDVSALDEVVVNAGYYRVKDRERTGNIAKVTSEELELQPVVNPLQALQGRVAGLEIVQRTGVPGTASTLMIRGQNSFRNDFGNNGNLPLYIVDGVPVDPSPIRTGGFVDLTSNTGIDPLNNISVANIESIEVLKDADATAIYGSRGANGVILITTKNGIRSGKEKTSLDISLYSGIATVSNKMELLNTEQFLEMRREAFANDGIENYPANAYDVNGTWDQSRYTDWQDKFFGRAATITDAQLSLSGGNELTSFRLGGAYHKEGTVFPGNFGYDRFNGFLNVNHISQNKRLKANVSVNYGVDQNKLFQSGTFVGDALTLSPNAPALYDEKGDLNWAYHPETGVSTWNNPFTVLNRTQEIKTNTLNVSSSVSYAVIDGLDIKVNAGYTKTDAKNLSKIPVSIYDPVTQGSRANEADHSETNRDSWIIEPQLSYTKRISKINLDIVLGGTFQKSNSDFLQMRSRGYSQERFIGDLSAADQVLVLSLDQREYVYSAVFGRIGFNWDRKYYLNLTGRRDGSSRFGPGRQFENFGAIGAAWIFSEEPFIKNTIPFLNFGKLRGSYGTTGNDQIPDYGFYNSYQTYLGGLISNGLYNPDYAWEVNKKVEAALELGVLNDRIHVEGSWYRNRSSNQLVDYPLSAVTGFSSITANLPALIQNKGWEIILTTKNIQQPHFSWETSFNISIPENKLLEFPNIEQSSYAIGYKVGHSLNIVKLFQYQGINPETGLYEVADINEDGLYNIDDRIVIQDRNREYYGGLMNQFHYKNLQLNFLLEFVKQTGISNAFLSTIFPPGFGLPFTGGNVPTNVADRWQNPGDDTNFQRYTQSFLNYTSYVNTRNSSVVYTDDPSFVRLKTISLSYTVPEKIIKESGLSSVLLFIHGQNLWTWTKYKGLDPQFPGGNVLPALRNVTCGLRVKF
ncbi:SusC/RagA family TonB-linked outer membrane protein [Sinomicrobium oceani]|uniref:SusC/RagA family TonB-linked outer membrane protein n=1 Tax=Sinomicrobium oceani TaxID=1150368 RepID=UPI00227ABC74|nr:SusC/RagA family TonB-linked outer membrane protein [Sinomicrobium oceani]